MLILYTFLNRPKTMLKCFVSKWRPYSNLPNFLHTTAYLPPRTRAFLRKKANHARVHVPIFSGEATTVRGPGCDKVTNLRFSDIAVVPLMPIHTTWELRIDKIILFWYPRLPPWPSLKPHCWIEPKFCGRLRGNIEGRTYLNRAYQISKKVLARLCGCTGLHNPSLFHMS